MALTEKTKKNLYNFLVVPIVIILSGVIRAVIVNIFVIPFNFATTGVTGIGILIEHKVPWFSAGYTTLILNVPLLILAFIYLGKRLTTISAISIGLSALGMILMNHFNVPTYEGGNPIFAAIIAGVLGGFGFAMMIRIGGSTGGTDIIAMLIQRKYPAINIAWFVYIVDAAIIFASVFVYQTPGVAPTVATIMNPVLMALLEEFAHAMVGDVILTGARSALKYEIITNEPEELSAEIINKLKRGVTCASVTGMYAHEERSLLICIIKKRQLADFNKILKRHPESFAYLVSAREVYGKGFSSHTP